LITKSNNAVIVETEDKLSVAVKMHEEGKSQRVIAERLNMSQPGVSKMLRNDKRRIAVQLEAERTARAKESEARVSVIDIMEGIVRDGVAAMEPSDSRMIQAVSMAVKLLAQLRGELIEKRENRNENHEVRDVDGDYFEMLLKRFSQMADADKGKTYLADSIVNPGATEGVLVKTNGGDGSGN